MGSALPKRRGPSLPSRRTLPPRRRAVGACNPRNPARCPRLDPVGKAIENPRGLRRRHRLRGFRPPPIERENVVKQRRVEHEVHTIVIVDVADLPLGILCPEVVIDAVAHRPSVAEPVAPRHPSGRSARCNLRGWTGAPRARCGRPDGGERYRWRERTLFTIGEALVTMLAREHAPVTGGLWASLKRL